jgi:hypothetical protein
MKKDHVLATREACERYAALVRGWPTDQLRAILLVTESVNPDLRVARDRILREELERRNAD